jgi:hypothetical protein
MLIETKCVMQSGYNYRIIKGTVACNDFWPNLTHLVGKEKICFMVDHYYIIEKCSVFRRYAYLLDSQKNIIFVNCSF